MPDSAAAKYADVPVQPVAARRVMACNGHPLGPLLVVRHLRRPIVGRLQAAAVVLGAGALLGLAAALKPDPSGHGTHTQLGLGPCGFLLSTGYPCPSCGMTTAFAFFAHGHVWASFLAQPTGFVLAAATAIAGVLALGAMLSGRIVSVNWYRVSPVRTAWGFAILFFGSWIFEVILTRLTRTGSHP